VRRSIRSAFSRPSKRRAPSLEDTDPQKREKLIDRLLAHPAFADYWANRWADLLRPNPDRVGVKGVYILDHGCVKASAPTNHTIDLSAKSSLPRETTTATARRGLSRSP
jgi:hypothetical protein